MTQASGLSPYMTHLANSTLAIMSQTSNFQHHLNQLRDGLRDILSHQDSDRFPRFGPHAVGVFEPLCTIFGNTSLQAHGQLICQSCCRPQITGFGTLHHNATDSNLYMASHIYGHESLTLPTTRRTISFDKWFAAYWLNCFPHHLLEQFPANQPCPSCSQQTPLALILQITESHKHRYSSFLKHRVGILKATRFIHLRQSWSTAHL